MAARTLFITSTALTTFSNAVAVLPKKDAFSVLKQTLDKKQYAEERPRLPESVLESFSEETKQHWDEYFPESRMEWITTYMSMEDYTEREYAECKPSNDLRAKFQWVYVPKFDSNSAAATDVWFTRVEGYTQ